MASNCLHGGAWRPAPVGGTIRAMTLRVKQIRESRGLTMEAVAHDLGWPGATLSRIENNKQNTTLDRLEQLARYYRVSMPELFEYDGDNDLIRLAWSVPADQASHTKEMLEVYLRHTLRQKP